MQNSTIAASSSTQGGRGNKQGVWSGRRKRDTIAGYLFLLPNLLGVLVFSLFPIGATIYLTFTEWDLASAPKFTGFNNFLLMVRDELFWKTLFNTFYYAFVAVPIAVFLAFWLALLINRKMWGVLSFRLIYFLPHITLTVAAAIVWAWIYSPEFGLINYLLSQIGIDGPYWLSDSRWAMPAIIIMSNWKGIGYAMLIFLAGLQGIPQELIDAATVDGATGWQRLRHVTIPLLTPTTFFIVTTSFIGAFQGFDQFYVMTQGGPAFSTTPLVLYIYNNGFQFFKMGYATSMAAVLFLCILTITIVQWRLASRWVYGFD
ncbi:sugar ABC transporter permease [Chloroflexi bacterium TSY]|nr:sugar ABC transporter permease [Chloroflexi bacterium TSY]